MGDTPEPHQILSTHHLPQQAATGGRTGGLYWSKTNQLWAFEEGEQTWTQPLPPMLTRRYNASAVSTQDHLIVAGGWNNSGGLNTVEVFDGQRWVIADPLPKSCSNIKSTSHDGHYYMMGSVEQHTSVFYTSLQTLVDKTTQHPPTSPTNTVWKTLPNTPHQWSSTTIFGGALVAVGGNPNQSSLHFYSPLTQSWLPAGEMPVGVECTCTVTLPTGEMMVIGGNTRDISCSQLVYKAYVKLQ